MNEWIFFSFTCLKEILHLGSPTYHDFWSGMQKFNLCLQSQGCYWNKYYILGIKTSLLPPFFCWLLYFFIVPIKLLKIYFHCTHNVLLCITLKCSLKALLGLFFLSFHLMFIRAVGGNKDHLGKVIFINNLKMFNDFLSPTFSIRLYC